MSLQETGRPTFGKIRKQVGRKIITLYYPIQCYQNVEDLFNRFKQITLILCYADFLHVRKQNLKFVDCDFFLSEQMHPLRTFTCITSKMLVC
jgi:hypothetical protein